MSVLQQYLTCIKELIPVMTPRKKRWFLTGFTLGLSVASMAIVMLSCAALPKPSVGDEVAFPLVIKMKGCKTSCGILTDSLSAKECHDLDEYERFVDAALPGTCVALKGVRLQVIDTQNGVFTANGKVWAGLSGCMKMKPEETGLILLGESPTPHSAFAHESQHIAFCRGGPGKLADQHELWRRNGTCEKIKSVSTGPDAECDLTTPGGDGRVGP
jgi:hypothetical protein